MPEPTEKKVPAAFARVLSAYEKLHEEYRKQVIRNMGLETYLMLYCVQHPHPEYEEKIKELCPAVWVEFKEWMQAERQEEEPPPPPQEEESIARQVERLLREAQVTLCDDRAEIFYSKDTLRGTEYLSLSSSRDRAIIEFPYKP